MSEDQPKEWTLSNTATTPPQLASPMYPHSFAFPAIICPDIKYEPEDSRREDSQPLLR
jgi:hypothetical protein